MPIVSNKIFSSQDRGVNFTFKSFLVAGDFTHDGSFIRNNKSDINLVERAQISVTWLMREDYYEYSLGEV
jgi:hypothetical protein